MKIISKIRDFLKVNTEDKAGLYLTIIFHLVILIVLLAYSIHYQIRQETTFILDFTAQEELEKARELEMMRESVSQELDALISGAQTSGQTPRNVAVDASQPLRDDRNTANEAERLYEDARELQERLNKSRRDAEERTDSEDDVAIEKRDRRNKDVEAYTGPAVISYTLDGRKDQYLPVPTYKCQAGGDVAVSIIVNRKGYVVGCKVIEGVSSEDECLRNYAIRAASRSRFSASESAPERQAGEILYRFVAQ